MKTKPKPSEMFLMTAHRGKIVHLGFRVNKNYQRFLCNRSVFYKKRLPKLTNKKRATCALCRKRYKKIQALIKIYGVEWVCDGIWLPMEQRTFKNVFSVGEY